MTNRRPTANPMLSSLNYGIGPQSGQRGESRQRNRFTRLGFHFLFVGAFAMLGGSIRGLNLLLVLAAVTVALLIVQWRVCKRMCESLSVQRRLPTEAFAGAPFRVRYRVANLNWFAPAWMMRVTDLVTSTDNRDSLPSFESAIRIGILAAGATATPSSEIIVGRRGRYEFDNLSIATAFPFALMLATQTTDHKQSIDVFPKLLPLQRDWRKRVHSRSGGNASTSRRSGATEGEFYGLRGWQSGDTLRQIHWRTTARLETPAVRQFEQQQRFDVCILVDGWLPGNADSAQNEQLEFVISMAATLAVQLSADPVSRVVLAVADQIPTTRTGGGQTGRLEMLRLLTNAAGTSSPDVVGAIEMACHSVGSVQELLVFSTRSQTQAAEQTDGLAGVLSEWARRGGLRWITPKDTAINYIFALGAPSAGSRMSETKPGPKSAVPTRRSLVYGAIG